MPNKQQGLLAFLCLNAGKGGLREQMIPELARHKRKETLCQSKELRTL